MELYGGENEGRGVTGGEGPKPEGVVKGRTPSRWAAHPAPSTPACSPAQGRAAKRSAGQSLLGGGEEGRAMDFDCFLRSGLIYLS